RSFTNFRGKLCLIAHGSILSKVGASSKPGAIHCGDELFTETEALQFIPLLSFANFTQRSRREF
ncbi:hypothetical protein, partial [Nitrosomonas europaea]|uniref:hypothetical protein n=1 Tax=Nitrosomonas europaea TaxID=915 RepID=UPI001C40ADF8